MGLWDETDDAPESHDSDGDVELPMDNDVDAPETEGDSA